MKWIFILACFTYTPAFSQLNNKSVLDKLKQTDRLINKPVLDNLNPADRLITKPNSGNLQREPIAHSFKQRQEKIIIPDNRERVVIALHQDNMPCIVPNMNLFKIMPNAGDITMLKKPIDPGIYAPIPKALNPTIKWEKMEPSN